MKVDTGAYMPDVAPQSWMREIAPLYDVLAQDRALLDTNGAESNEASVHARLAEGVRPDNPALVWRWPDFDFGSPIEMLRASGEIGRQALMVSYTDSFWLLYVCAFALAPMVVLLRYRKQQKS